MKTMMVLAALALLPLSPTLLPPQAWAPRAGGVVVAVAAAPAAAGVPVSGTVAGSDQGFLDGATVVIDGPQHKEARTDADGRFTISDVARGRYQLHVSADGYLPMDRPMDVGDASISVDIVLLRLPGL